MKNNKVIGFTTTPGYCDNSYSAFATYTVIAVAESGALSPSTVATSGITSKDNVSNRNKVYAYTIDRNLVVKNVAPGTQISMYGVTGILLSKKMATSSVVSFDFVSPCILKVVNGTNSSVLKVLK